MANEEESDQRRRDDEGQTGTRTTGLCGRAGMRPRRWRGDGDRGCGRTLRGRGSTAHYGKKDGDEDEQTAGTWKQGRGGHPQPQVRATARRVETGNDGEGEGTATTTPAIYKGNDENDKDEGHEATRTKAGTQRGRDSDDNKDERRGTSNEWRGAMSRGEQIGAECRVPGMEGMRDKAPPSRFSWGRFFSFLFSTTN